MLPVGAQRVHTSQSNSHTFPISALRARLAKLSVAVDSSTLYSALPILANINTYTEPPQQPKDGECRLTISVGSQSSLKQCWLNYTDTPSNFRPETFAVRTSTLSRGTARGNACLPMQENTTPSAVQRPQSQTPHLECVSTYQSCNDVAQCRQWLVNGGSLFGSLSFSSRLCLREVTNITTILIGAFITTTTVQRGQGNVSKQW